MKYLFLITSLMISTTHRLCAMDPQNITNFSLFIQEYIEKKTSYHLREYNEILYSLYTKIGMFHPCCGKPKDENIAIELFKQKNGDLTKISNGIARFLMCCTNCGTISNEKSIIQLLNDENKNNDSSAFMIDNVGDTALHLACIKKHTKIIDFLAQDNTIINKQDYNGDTPLHIACQNGQFDIIKLLIKNNANPTIKNNEQITPLLELYTSALPLDSFLNDNPSVAKQLIQETDNFKNSQLHLCTTIESINDISIGFPINFDLYLQLLMNKGLNIHARNTNGKRAVDLACEAYHDLYHAYVAKKTSPRENELTNQEKIMHAFLRFTSPHTPCEGFKHVLNTQLPQDVIPHIMCKYYALNIETIVAKKYKYNNDYYKIYIKNKHKIKQRLLENPEPQLLWKTV